MIDKKVYLASPFFNDMERGGMQATLSALRTQYSEVYAPFEHTIPNAWDMSNKEWGKAVFQADIEAIKQADIVYVIDHGHYSDAGTAWECGFAYALGKEVIHCIVDITATYSLMMANGCTTSSTDFDVFMGEVK